jgi:ribosomal protein L37E
MGVMAKLKTRMMSLPKGFTKDKSRNVSQVNCPVCGSPAYHHQWGAGYECGNKACGAYERQAKWVNPASQTLIDRF